MLSYVLERDGGLVYGKDYVVRSGILDSEFGEVPTHFWIEFNGSKHGGMILDYRARMWLGDREEVPNGFFDPKEYKKVEYIPMRLLLSNTHVIVFNTLIKKWDYYEG